jgi:hypothetical protein
MKRHIKSLYSFGKRKNCYKNENKNYYCSVLLKGDKLTNNYRGISLLYTSYIVLSYILLKRMNPYAN